MEAEQVRVLIPDLGQSIETDDMELIGTQEALEQRPFQIFEARNVSASGAFTFRLRQSAPGGGALPTGPRVLPISPLERLPWWAPLLPITLALLGVVAYVLTRPAPSGIEQRTALRERRDALVAEIAALDIRFEAGAIGEQTHARQRRALKEELKETLRRLGTATPETR
jgi:hypothetical protein